MLRWKYRAVFLLVALILLAPVASAFVIDSTSTKQTKRIEDVQGPIRPGYTAITTQSFQATYPESELVILSPNGSATYVNDKFDTYFDVDPVSGSPHVVEYVVARELSGEICDNAETCTKEVLVRENFETGASEILWSRISPGKHSTRIHDIDRINSSWITVADIYPDSVYIYDLDRGIQVWRWDAQRDYNVTSGGPYPNDWTHVNDVEVLDNRTLMVSLRNHDSVVYLSKNGSLLGERTLGSDGDHDTLYEQHNPDSLNHDGSVVLVGDSENNRVIEYEYLKGGWEPTWWWTDSEVQWPRDADRLPNGHTLITDSNGNRVIEINRAGEIVWEVDVGLPYEAERLSTPAESVGGQTASAANLTASTSRIEDTLPGSSSWGGGTIIKEIRSGISNVIPSTVKQGIMFILPPWASTTHLILILAFLVEVAVYAAVEFRLSRWRLRLPFESRGNS